MGAGLEYPPIRCGVSTQMQRDRRKTDCREMMLAKAMRVARDYGYVFLNAQELGFPSWNGGYSSETERVFLRCAPMDIINAWHPNMPRRASALCDPETEPYPVRDDPPREDRGTYTGLEDVKVWDSWSSHAYDVAANVLSSGSDGWSRARSLGARSGLRRIEDGGHSLR